MKIRAFRVSDRAAAMVEFAIVLPVLLLIVFGIVDFGRALYTLNDLTAAAREGARKAAVQLPDPTTAAVQSTVKSTVRAYVIAFGGDSLKDSDINVTYNPSTAIATLQSINVQIVSYPFKPITPLAGMIGMGTITMSPSATFRWEAAP
jgi:Flp pilus assembly protein TadG